MMGEPKPKIPRLQPDTNQRQPASDMSEKLPNEIWAKLLSQLKDVKDLCHLELVNRKFRRLALDACWTHIQELTLFNQDIRAKDLFKPAQSSSGKLNISWSTATANLTKALLEKLTGLTSLSLDHRDNFEEHLPLEKVQKLKINGRWDESCDSPVGEVVQRASKSLTELQVEPYSALGRPTAQTFHKLSSGIISCKQLVSLNLELVANCPERYCQILASGNLKNLKKLKLTFEGNWEGFAGNFPDALLQSGTQLEDLALTDGTPAVERYLGKVSGSQELEKSHPLISLKKLTLITEKHGKLLSTSDLEVLLDLCPDLEIFAVDLYPKTLETLETMSGYIQLMLSKGRSLQLTCRGNVLLGYSESGRICGLVKERLRGVQVTDQCPVLDDEEDISPRDGLLGVWMFMYQGTQVRLGYKFYLMASSGMLFSRALARFKIPKLPDPYEGGNAQ